MAMKERFFRIEAMRLPTAEIAQLLETSEQTLARWIAGRLPTDEEDVIEVGLSLLERHSSRSPAEDDKPTPRFEDDEPTLLFASVRVA
jgi:hypothetical protein